MYEGAKNLKPLTAVRTVANVEDRRQEMAWSGAVKLADLNDYIGPSQACIKPLQPPSGTKAKVSGGSMIEVQLENTDPAPSATKSEFKQIRSDAQRKTAKVSLADCLACSGCITSAETVLVMQQSLEEFFASFAPSKVHVVTLSPQSRAALAVKYNLTLLQVAKKMTTVMKQLGVSHVFDSSFALDISLIEAREEFLQRYRNSKTNSQPSAALPVLTSECPGWICYAEKAQGHALPSVSAVKSPQQIMGSLVKLHLAKSLNVTPDQIYHVTVMPCYDKKLEASRPDFFDEQYQTRDVDCVLATSEIEELFVQKNIDFASVAESPLDTLFSNVDPEQQILYYSSTESAGSGGYLENIFRYAAKQLFQVDFCGQALPYKVGRNADTRDVTLEINGERVLSFATAYGFRNIQNITRQIKSNSIKYDYVEIMACPSGCVNGGGQIKSVDPTKGKELIKSVDVAFHAIALRDPADNPAVRELYARWVGDAPGSVRARALFHTAYRAVPKSEELNPLAIRW